MFIIPVPGHRPVMLYHNASHIKHSTNSSTAHKTRFRTYHPTTTDLCEKEVIITSTNLKSQSGHNRDRYDWTFSVLYKSILTL